MCYTATYFGDNKIRRCERQRVETLVSSAVQVVAAK
jgi:hypothetical protein